MTLVQRAIATALVMTLAVACGDNNDSHRESEPDGPSFYRPDDRECEPTLHAFLVGDSMTYAGFHHSYARLIKSEFSDGAVNNAGVFSTTTDDFRPGSMLYDALRIHERPPRFLALLVGTHDGREGNFPSTVRENLVDFIEEALSDGACQVVIMTPPAFVDDLRDSESARSLVAEYAADIRHLCSYPGDDLICGPDLERLIDSSMVAGPSLMSRGIEPNEEGHRIIFEELLPLLVH